MKAIPSYLRFGKFLVRLTHVGQQNTCRRCNGVGHFAKECAYKVCFNSEKIGHESRDSEEEIRCSICKDTSHMAQACRFSWVKETLEQYEDDVSETHRDDLRVQREEPENTNVQGDKQLTRG